MNKNKLNRVRNVRHYSIILNTTPGTSYVEYITIILDLLISKIQKNTYMWTSWGILADELIREGFCILSRPLTKTGYRQK